MAKKSKGPKAKPPGKRPSAAKRPLAVLMPGGPLSLLSAAGKSKKGK
jgi:hypothetical protein